MKERSASLREVLEKSARKYRQSFVGTIAQVLWEGTKNTEGNQWMVNGLTSNYLRIHAISHQDMWNRFSQVRLDGLVKDGLFGNILD
jgi:tRNA A37 methylthiotransferase MiaB